MGGLRRFYGWEDYSKPEQTTLLQERISILDRALYEAFRPDNSVTPALQVGRIRPNATADSGVTVQRAFSIGGGSYSLRLMKTTGTTTAEISLIYSPVKKEVGITRLGIRMSRGTTGQAPSVYIAGNFQNVQKTERYNGYSVGYTTSNEIYVEIEINWTEGKVSIYQNDLIGMVFYFSTLSYFLLGSFTKPSYNRTEPTVTAGAATISWGYPAGQSNSWQTWSDIYMSYWDGEGEDWGRYGPIYCKALAADTDSTKVAGSLKGYPDVASWLTSSLSFAPYLNNGVVTNGVNAETVVEFPLPDPSTVGGEILGYSFSTTATQNDSTQPLTIDSKMYYGDEEEVMNPNVAASEFDSGATSSLVPNRSSGYIDVSDLTDVNKISVGVKLVRRS